ncbi:MAG: efflux RND transporter periplasmic adaptor subunit [Saprospiraceae bacterium]
MKKQLNPVNLEKSCHPVEMKYLVSLITLFFLVVACQEEVQIDPNAIPTDLTGKKEFLKNKKAEVRQLTQLIKKTEAEIDALIPDNQKARTLITTSKVELKDFERFVDIQAAVEADDMVAASSETGGRILQMNFKEGDNIRKGQLVAKIDLEQIDKQVAELQTSMTLAKDVFERQSRLWKQNIGSELQYLEAKNNVERLEKSLETIEFQKTKANVYAPISGVIEMVGLKQGEMASPGMPIIQILNTNKVKVVADIPETYLGKVKRGEMVTIKFPALDKEIQAKISQIGRTIDPANRTFEAEINLNNSKGIYKPNLLASMLINDFEAKNVPVIPVEMVQQEVSGKDYVYIKETGKKGAIAKKIYVETGENYNGEVIIKSGLTGGEALIMEGARGLAENQLVKIAG